MSFFKIFPSAHSAPGNGSTSDKSKGTPTTDRPATQPKKMLPEEMAKLGITRVPVDYYHYGVFRYTSLKDALAQAKRDVQS